MNLLDTKWIASQSADELASSIAAISGPILPVGARTKPALSACDSTVTWLDMRTHSGIVSYDPSEFLISARAGTPLQELRSALDEQRQYLPFDPLFVSQGATLGGTVASGLSGAGRMLYGSLRDFVMEVQMIDGLGKIVRGGGKVVKNAAGFDLPKLVVGSYGRLGVVTEVTLKVFPRPPATATFQAQAESVHSAIAATQSLLAQPLPITALDLEPQPGGMVILYARFAAPSDSLAEVLRRAELACRLPGRSICDSSQEQQLWLDRAAAIEHIGRTGKRVLIRIATTLSAIAQLSPALQAVDTAELHYTGGGSVAWLSLSATGDLSEVDKILSAQHLPAIVVVAPEDDSTEGASRLTHGGLRPLGDRTWLAIAERIAKAIDPHQKFVAW